MGLDSKVFPVAHRVEVPVGADRSDLLEVNEGVKKGGELRIPNSPKTSAPTARNQCAANKFLALMNGSDRIQQVKPSI
jgi:hypothetical protein